MPLAPVPLAPRPQSTLGQAPGQWKVALHTRLFLGRSSVCVCMHTHTRMWEQRPPLRGWARCWPPRSPLVPSLTGPEGVGEVLATPRSSGAQPHGCPSVCSTTDVHTVASLLKLYLRELPEPVVPFARYEDFLNCAQLLTKDEWEVSGSWGPMLGEWAC